MNSIALSAGFGCVRRFNAAIRKTYNRTPTQIRRLTRQQPTQPENEYLLNLRFRPPYHWKGMLEFLAARALPGVEAVDDQRYRRSISLNGCPGYFEVSLDEANLALAVRVQIAQPQLLFVIIERIRRMFDLNVDWAAIEQGLGGDPELTALIATEPGLRVPGSWDGFELTTRAILGEQTSVRAAAALAGRLAKRFGRPVSLAAGLTRLFPTPEKLADAHLTSAGVGGKRAQIIQAVARAVVDGRINFERIVDCDAFTATLREIPGIDHAKAQYVAMRALGDPDAFPCSDSDVLRGLGMTTSRGLMERVATWRPWRSYASMYLWNAAKNTRRTATPMLPESILRRQGSAASIYCPD
ncbi:MAG TPA: AlkA N-terminal domain-containing protein, partial [Candidatus Angelobacter sp.]|nr:AlkA N-terminal domain-containing protein [Candidatus Angelobacter sp.]